MACSAAAASVSASDPTGGSSTSLPSLFRLKIKLSSALFCSASPLAWSDEDVVSVFLPGRLNTILPNEDAES
jgi:hypothetical protein